MSAQSNRIGDTKPNLVVEGDIAKHGEAVRPNWFREMASHDVANILQERWQQQLPQHSYAVKNETALPQWRIEETQQETIEPERPKTATPHNMKEQSPPHPSQGSVLPKSRAPPQSPSPVHRPPPQPSREYCTPPRPASPVTTYAQITLQSHLITPPLSPLTLDTRHDDESKVDLYSPSWDTYEDSDDDQTTVPASSSSVQGWIQPTSSVPRLHVSGTGDDDDEEEEDEDDRNVHDESDEQEAFEIRSAPPSMSMSATMNDDINESMSNHEEPSESSFSATEHAAVQKPKPLHPQLNQQRPQYERRRPVPLPPSSPSSPRRLPPSHQSSHRRSNSHGPSGLPTSPDRKQCPRKPSKSQSKRGNPPVGTSSTNKKHKPKLSFGGRNFNPGSKGWDPKEWGVSSSDPDYKLYKDGVKLPESYIQAIMTYAKAIGIIENGEELEPSWFKPSLPPASPHDKKRAIPPLALSPSRSKGGDGDES